jgi:hypothetical protein
MKTTIPAIPATHLERNWSLADRNGANARSHLQQCHCADDAANAHITDTSLSS